jgi:hypothetical protein
MLVIAALSPALSPNQARAADGPLVAYFPPSVDAVVASSDLCIRRNIMIIEQDERHVVCSQEMGGLKGAFAQILIGNSYSTTPTLNLRFSLSKTRDYTVVQATQWVETQMAFGQVRREGVNGGKSRRHLQEALLGAGGFEYPRFPPSGTSEVPPKAVAAPVADSVPAPAVSQPPAPPAAPAPKKIRSEPAAGVRCITC